MFYNADFFQNLYERAVEQLGPGHACSKALHQAVRDHSQSNVTSALEQLNKLEADILQQLLQQTHTSWATDLSAILGQWSGDPSAKN